MLIQQEVPLRTRGGEWYVAEAASIAAQAAPPAARVVVVLAVGVAVAATALAIWWLNSLNGLPDIGDPFDVAAFRAFRLPDEQNAFTYLRRASEKLTPIVGMVGGNGADPGELKFSWSIANPTLREWAGENREAFELFQQGAEQADAANPAGDPTDNRFITGA